MCRWSGSPWALSGHGCCCSKTFSRASSTPHSSVSGSSSVGSTSWLEPFAGPFSWLCFSYFHAKYLFIYFFNNKSLRITARGIVSRRTGGRSGSWCSAHLFSSYLTWVKGKDAAAAFEVTCCAIVPPFVNHLCALFLIKGGSLDQSLLQCLGIRNWDEGGSILRFSLNLILPLKWLPVIQSFSFTVTTDNLHRPGRDFCLSVFPLPVLHGSFCVQKHWWEITPASCNARGQKTAV